MKKIIFFAVLLGCCVNVLAQKITPQEYIELYKDLAIREMKRMGVPAAITLAQGILETESGNSILVKKSNNHFGIKCKGSWNAGGVSHDDDEKGECFRTYKTAEDSYRDHSNFLRGNQRYSFLFKLDPADYRSWCHGLKKAGYATNPSYPQILINNIEKYNLNQYTLEFVNEVAKFDGSLYESDKENTSISSVLVSENEEAVSNNINIPSNKNQKTYLNGLKAVYAQKGTSLLAIATEQEIALVKLLEFNDLKEDGILQNEQWIFLEKKREQGSKDFYIVQENETLYAIAQNNALQLKFLLDYNSLKEDDVLQPGTSLKLRPVSQVATNIDAIKKNTYIVQPKDSLYAIARKYNITVEQIKEWNNLNADDLKIGQEIIVSK